MSLSIASASEARVQRRGWICFWALGALFFSCLLTLLPDGAALLGTSVSRPEPPSAQHWFGTDLFGRDLFLVMLRGLGELLLLSMTAAGAALTLGSAVGLVQSEWSGVVGSLTRKLAETLGSLPILLVLLALCAAVRPIAWVLALLLGLFMWPGVAQVVDRTLRRERRRHSFLAAQALGQSLFGLLHGHLLPAMGRALLTILPRTIGFSLLTLAAIDFLGLAKAALPFGLGQLLAQALDPAIPWWVEASGPAALALVLYLLLQMHLAVQTSLSVSSEASVPSC